MGCCQSKGGEGAYRRGGKAPAMLMEDLMPKLSDSSRVAVLRLVGLRDIPAANTFSGWSDSYVEFQLAPSDPHAGNQKQISSIKPSTLKPKWEPPEKFQFITTQPKDSRVILSVFHYVYGKPNDAVPLGDGVLRIKDLPSSGQIEKVLKLTNPSNGKPAGEAVVMAELMTLEDAASVQEQILYEFQRWAPSLHNNWNGGDDPSKNLLSSDPGRWCRGDGSQFGKTMESVMYEVPSGWEVISPWHTVATDTDPEGWQYAVDFKSPYWHPSFSSSTYIVRRRSWHRDIRKGSHLRSKERSPSIAQDGTAAPANKSGRRQRLVLGRKSQ